MIRRPDWQSRLSAYIVDCAHRPFRYGELDCGLFVAGAIETMTGIDVAGELRGKYRFRREAFAAIRALCGQPTMAAIADHLAAQFGIEPIAPTFASRGDAVQLRSGQRASLGIVDLHSHHLLTPYSAGLLRLPMSHAVRAWRI
ncbi:DUF6950 family protein [Occallatibacter riparius]|uniref:DUF6950 domain-containing protein n=1 Tax=Occallatibacter riparius TaxID=1002689 RepID=A0A9J7BPY8_9BACT|nr:hypothetical protein [Occallatibacter riparius]UWZ84663.1 hypothetical protein MOP44_01710 [Occallatibacter riparius]